VTAIQNIFAGKQWDAVMGWYL